MKSDQIYPKTTKEIYNMRTALAPETMEAFQNFSKAVFKEGVLPEKTKNLLLWQLPMLHNALIAYAAILNKLCGKVPVKKK